MSPTPIARARPLLELVMDRERPHLERLAAYGHLITLIHRALPKRKVRRPAKPTPWDTWARGKNGRPP